MKQVEIYGYVAKPALLQMLCLHLLGSYSDKEEKNVNALKEILVIDENDNVVELSPYFEQKVSEGYFSDDYFEFKQFDVSSSAESKIAIRAHRWIYGPTVEK